jgi:hypothetical protein
MTLQRGLRKTNKRKQTRLDLLVVAPANSAQGRHKHSCFYPLHGQLYSQYRVLLQTSVVTVPLHEQ